MPGADIRISIVGAFVLVLTLELLRDRWKTHHAHRAAARSPRLDRAAGAPQVIDPNAPPTRHELEAFQRIARRRRVFYMVTLATPLLFFVVPDPVNSPIAVAPFLLVAYRLCLSSCPRCGQPCFWFWRREVGSRALLPFWQKFGFSRCWRCRTKIDWTAEEAAAARA